jgi:SM-20-related protein
LANSLKQNLLAKKKLIVAGTGNSEVIAYDTAVPVIPFIGWIKAQ